MNAEGRSTPLPQYEKTQSVPFTLTLQEEKNNPGKFQLVVNIDPEKNRSDGSPPNPTASKKLFANLQTFPSLGYDVSPLYRTQKSSPPMSPQQERQEWSDLDAIPPDFLQKVVPDWNVSFERSASTASSQSRKLADIKARIKKSGKGFVVRLLKGSNPDSKEVAEVHLAHQNAPTEATFPELDSSPRVELDATEDANVSQTEQVDSANEQPAVFEIGTSSEPGIQKRVPSPPTARVPSIPHWLNQSSDNRTRYSISEDWLSDAETLTQETRPFSVQLDDDPTDLEPSSTNSSKLPTRTASISSIVKTPTRGLSVIGPVKRVAKGDRARGGNGKGNAARLYLNRSDAKKSFKRRSPPNFNFASTIESAAEHLDISSQGIRHRVGQRSRSQNELQDEYSARDSETWHHPARDLHPNKYKVHHRSSLEDIPRYAEQKTKLRLETNVPRPISANTSPVNKRKRSPRVHKPSSSTSSVQFADQNEHIPSPARSEVDPCEELREVLEAAFGGTENNVDHTSGNTSIPAIQEPIDDDSVGEISMPPGLETRSAPTSTKNPAMTFLGLALNALSDKLFEGFQALRDKYGGEPPVPPNHVRVRWTCSCGEPLYDDFIERRRGAARLLEAYLNRPRAHTPTSPTGRTSTSSTMSSVFSSISTTSTLATPASTYGGPSSRGQGDSSRYSPTRLRSINPFSVRIGGYVEEQWLLTCANEGRFTPKIVHIDVNASRIKSDKDLALALREHYDQLNRRWLRWTRLRGLTTIEFVQFEVHRNRFADIRATPSMPPTSSTSSSKSPSEQPYSFEPVDLIPPVGSTYLLHLFKHPSDYDGELITYLRSPKRRQRLEFGMGWGINLVEGFLAQKVWGCILMGFGVGSCVFAITWCVKWGDVQGAFGVAGWVVTLAGLVLGGLQAWLD
ncbi:hypothetical protein K469DRAFT_572058 [Zopfia rhizophila CBS 207.26]|uniref:Uncharacterized protein n=1 Tax=Zopfia rhizophila CBS 207.26 TaxID=1314779 RepID=A0A6A6E3U8_9PEZI|nr:hypothetical protein K469DRAFT_572058 [Zopfia rhizophila CBS 207.26]